MSEPSFAALAERHRRELHVHCYRMVASFDKGEDAVQETFLRAWRGRDTFDGSSLYRAWLCRIATNVCLDMLRRSARRLPTMDSFAEVAWLQPSYLCRPGDSAYRAFKLDVLCIQDGVIAEITTFGPGLFPAFGLPPTL